MGLISGSFWHDGYEVFESVLDSRTSRRAAAALVLAEQRVVEQIGQDRVAAAGDVGIIRLAMQFDPVFLEILQNPALLAAVGETVGPTAILHLQNGLVVRPAMTGTERFGFRYHQDFPRYLNGYLASVNILINLDEYTSDNGATRVVPRSHQRADSLSQEEAESRSLPVLCPPGSLIVFDSTLWHAAGLNTTNTDRTSLNHQFTRPWIKQQIDYVRALGDEVVLRCPDRTQQLLGWYTRVVTSLDEYYLPADQRLYRAGQG